MLSAVVAMAHDRVIGNKNDLPWYLPADLRHFREITTGHAVIMGRVTCDSIIARLGHGLPNRTNIAVTRDPLYKPEGITVVHSIPEALGRIGTQDAFVIGGAKIYEQTLQDVDRLLVTEVDADIDGDTRFPEIDPAIWEETSREAHQKDPKNPFDYAFVTYDRR